ncbi:hypothetical protein BD289DRAFT_463920 [Coniella lustricola]|uniref:Transcription factor domain-containing protein n=1 Tax=Coniella lustricola TaxID=2025994 RepID=A0A2T2ZTD2_9PEZI|nr:hypothetical protein BD289DRAFT_463920 [Coniella lustricola]
MKIDDIVASFAAPLPDTGLMPTPQSVDELTKIYYELYVPGLCQFFETEWFNFKTEGHNPVTIFLHNRPLIALLGSFLVSLHTVNADPAHTAYCANLEMRVVWALTKLAYVVPIGTNMPRDEVLPDDDASEIRNRVFVFETLLSGNELASNPLIPPPKYADAQRRKEFEFWYCLADFLVQQQQQQQQGPAAARQSEYRQQLLYKMRTLLDGRENRDLLYSMVVIRHYSPDFEPGWENRVPDHLNEKDPLNQLHVAIQFVKAESAPVGGTTNVVRHLAFLAARALINPGCNLAPRKA